MAARGRPTFEPTDKHRGQVDAMTRYGIPVAEIARVIGITKPTLFKRQTHTRSLWHGSPVLSVSFLNRRSYRPRRHRSVAGQPSLRSVLD